MLSSCHERLGQLGSELLAVDAALMPLLKLYRVLHLAQPVEKQLEPSELDPLSFGVTTAYLAQAARDLGCEYLEAPTGRQPCKGVIKGPKHHILLCRNATINKETRCVVFILDTSAPISYVCHDTLRAFGLLPELQPSINGRVRASIEDGVGLDLFIVRPSGPLNDLNVLGMDYMMRTNSTLKINSRAATVELELH